MENNVVIACEKPYGRNLGDCQALNSSILETVTEKQVYRIDHYLGKWTVDALKAVLLTRTTQALLNVGVDSVQICLAEKDGIGDRGEFYEPNGAGRDMLQNHGIELLLPVARALPNYPNIDTESVHDINLAILEKTRLVSYVLAQYIPGEIDGKPVKGYREEAKVNPDSMTPTYVAVKLDVNGIPFYIRTGKRLPKKVSEISIHLISGEVLVFRLQPNPALILWSYHLIEEKLQLVPMKFEYPPQVDAPYGVLLVDMMRGDQTRSVLSLEAEAAWRIVDPALGDKNCDYEAGSWGPAEAALMIMKDNRRWWVPGQG